MHGGEYRRDVKPLKINSNTLDEFNTMRTGHGESARLAVYVCVCV